MAVSLLNGTFLSIRATAAEDLKVLVPSWKKLEDEVFAELPDVFEEHTFAKTKTFERLLASGNSVLWNSLIEESDSDVLALLGFLCIAKAESKNAPQAAIRTLCRVQRPAGETLAPVYKVLREHRWSVKDVEMLKAGTPEDRIALIVVNVPSKVLAEWLTSPDVETAPASLVAYALDKVLTEAGGDRQAAQTASLSQERKGDLLNKLADCPGIPRCVYLIHADFAPNAGAELEAALTDDSIPDIHIALVVRRWARTIKPMLPRLKDSLSEKRLGLIEKAVARYEKDSRP